MTWFSEPRLALLCVVVLVVLVVIGQSGAARKIPAPGRTCAACGERSPGHARFCRRCGQRIS